MGTVAASPLPLSVEDYPEGEQSREVRHEYVGGYCYAMGVSLDAHKLIALSLASELVNKTTVRPDCFVAHSLTPRLSV